jgi:CheY-like chemotaxis protein
MIDFRMAELEQKSSDRPHAVLVVEDEPLVRELVVEYLASMGYLVLASNDAEGAIDTLMDHKIDLVFSDVQMPGVMDGHDLAEWIATNYPNVRVLLTSGVSSDRGHGVGRLLRKPYDFETLRTRIVEALAAPRRRGSDPAW